MTWYEISAGLESHVAVRDSGSEETSMYSHSSVKHMRSVNSNRQHKTIIALKRINRAFEFMLPKVFYFRNYNTAHNFWLWQTQALQHALFWCVFAAKKGTKRASPCTSTKDASEKIMQFWSASHRKLSANTLSANCAICIYTWIYNSIAMFPMFWIIMQHTFRHYMPDSTRTHCSSQQKLPKNPTNYIYIVTKVHDSTSVTTRETPFQTIPLQGRVLKRTCANNAQDTDIRGIST